MNPFETWLESDTGKKCRDYKTLLTSMDAQKYLENRLYHAFCAGMIDEYQKSKQLQQTIDWYEQKMKLLKAEIQEKNLLLQEVQHQPLVNG